MLPWPKCLSQPSSDYGLIDYCNHQQLNSGPIQERHCVLLVLLRCLLARHGANEVMLPVTIVEGSGPSLVGQNWLSTFPLEKFMW